MPSVKLDLNAYIFCWSTGVYSTLLCLKLLRLANPDSYSNSSKPTFSIEKTTALLCSSRVNKELGKEYYNFVEAFSSPV